MRSSPERINNCWNDPRYQEAAQRYQLLLDYYGIWPEVQAKVWESMLLLPPQKFIEEVNNYWEETFGANGKNGKDNNNETQIPNLQTQLYQSRREQWNSYRNNKRK